MEPRYHRRLYYDPPCRVEGCHLLFQGGKGGPGGARLRPRVPVGSSCALTRRTACMAAPVGALLPLHPSTAFALRGCCGLLALGLSKRMYLVSSIATLPQPVHARRRKLREHMLAECARHGVQFVAAEVADIAVEEGQGARVECECGTTIRSR